MKNHRLTTVFLVVISFSFFQSCSKDEDTVTPVVITPQIPSVSSEFFFSSEIDNQNVTLEHNKGSYFNGAGNTGGTLAFTYQNAEYTSFLHLDDVINESQDHEAVYIYFVQSFVNNTQTLEERISCVKEGTNDFGILERGDDKFKNGVVISYLDNNGKEWTTDFGLADQSGSDFDVTEYNDHSDFLIEKKFKANFNCTLYDGIGNLKTLTNGEVSGQIINL